MTDEQVSELRRLIVEVGWLYLETECSFVQEARSSLEDGLFSDRNTKRGKEITGDGNQDT